MKKDNILTKKAKQCLTCRNFIYDVSLLGLEGFGVVCKGSKSPGAGGADRIGRGRAGEVVARQVAPRKILCLARGGKFMSSCLL